MSSSAPTAAAAAMARPLLTRQSRWLPARASFLLTTRPAVRSLASCTRCGSHDPCPSNNVPSAACPPPSLLGLGPSPMSNLIASTQPPLIAPALPAESATSAATAAARRARTLLDEQTQLLQTTFYRRPLPASLTSFTSPEGKRLFKESLKLGFSENYFSLAATFTTQSEPAYCGLGSLAMVLNALEVDPKKRWKGGWRWYSDEMLECCAPLDVIRKKGITFKEFACIAKCNGLSVIAKQADHVTFDEFEHDLRACTSNAFPTETHMVVSFSRKSLGQTGDGHFSPVTSYHPADGKVLVLDTARFKYPSYYVAVKQLYEAMLPNDPETGLPRGYCLLQRRADAGVADMAAAVSATAATAVPALVDVAPALPLCQVRNTDTRDASWVRVARVFCAHVPRAIAASAPLHDAERNPQTLVAPLVARMLGAIPPTFDVGFTAPGIDRTAAPSLQTAIADAHIKRGRALVASVTAHPLYAIVCDVLAGRNPAGEVDEVHTHGPVSPVCGHVGDQRLQRWAQVNAGPAAAPAMAGPVAATILLLSMPREAYVRATPKAVYSAFEGVRARAALAGPLKHEVERIHDQLQSLTHEYCACDAAAPGREGERYTGACKL
ncbi:hypothetical protein GGF31_003871 [Allomyces arbusculus]|nr:hypothetical protein GGF31_003871 [Allomyces arbusculus]